MTQRRGIALGWLETVVLDQLWAHGAADVATMHARAGAPRELSRNTIQSTLERLYRKGLADRYKCGRAYEYRARLTRGEWLTQSLSRLLDATPGTDSALVLSAFVDLAERTGEANLEALEALVRARRRERGDPT
ncbi:MAG TPA: BlaI/MecI/CopY family transcriptional regulator [Myxococcota bacterium]|nr:BlaI/MecI/CopY family transcriptional regulator [Myxococcota bacterium]